MPTAEQAYDITSPSMVTPLESEWPPEAHGRASVLLEGKHLELCQLAFFLSFLKNFMYVFIYFWLCWVFAAVRAFSSCGERGLLLVAVRGLLIAVASLVVEHRLQADGLQ